MRVGHCQALIKKPQRLKPLGFFGYCVGEKVDKGISFFVAYSLPPSARSRWEAQSASPRSLRAEGPFEYLLSIRVNGAFSGKNYSER